MNIHQRTAPYKNVKIKLRTQIAGQRSTLMVPMFRHRLAEFQRLRGVFFDIRDKSSSGWVKNYTAKPNSVSESTSVELQMVPKGFLARAIGFQPCPSKVGYIVGPLRPPCFGLHSLI